MIKSTPGFFDFYPHLDWQKDLLGDILNDVDYKKGTYTALCSGSLGSGKSVVASHLAVRHCMDYANANVLIGRKALPDLKDTLFTEIINHLDTEELQEGRDYFVNETRARIRFKNGSLITGRSWSDRKYKKLGSLNLSAAIIEEAAENDEEDEKAIDYIKMRVGRLPHIPVRWIILLTNPDSPSHWLYKRYIEKKSQQHRVYYSNLKDNPFLDESYERGLAEDMDPKLALRMLKGQWVDIYGETIYHAYDKEINFKDEEYRVSPYHPIRICYDFNIGDGKPLSACLFQAINGVIHVFSEVVIEGMRTEDSLEEMAGRGLLDMPNKYIVHGDATGRARDTRSKRSDYGIIKKYLDNYKNKKGRFIKYEIKVPRSNPPIRKRHNIVNAYCQNANGRARLFVYPAAKTVDEGLRLTKLKSSGQYIEDDSKHYQHITTALGYGICSYEAEIKSGEDIQTYKR